MLRPGVRSSSRPWSCPMLAPRSGHPSARSGRWPSRRPGLDHVGGHRGGDGTIAEERRHLRRNGSRACLQVAARRHLHPERRAGAESGRNAGGGVRVPVQRDRLGREVSQAAGGKVGDDPVQVEVAVWHRGHEGRRVVGKGALDPATRAAANPWVPTSPQVLSSSAPPGARTAAPRRRRPVCPGREHHTELAGDQVEPVVVERQIKRIGLPPFRARRLA